MVENVSTEQTVCILPDSSGRSSSRKRPRATTISWARGALKFPVRCERRALRQWAATQGAGSVSGAAARARTIDGLVDGCWPL